MNNFGGNKNFLFRQITRIINFHSQSIRILNLDSNEMKFGFSIRKYDLNVRIIIIIKSKLSKVSFQYDIRLSIIWRVTSL